MSSSTSLSSENPQTAERRTWPRESLQRLAVVFFENGNWGKLLEINEGGMSLKFTQPPRLRQRINFTVMPVPRQGELLENSFEEVGEILWTRASERVAGVRFLDLAEPSRQRIRRWHSSGTPMEGTMLGQEVQAGVQSGAQPQENLTSPSETLPELEFMEAATENTQEAVPDLFLESEPQVAAGGVGEVETPEPLVQSLPDPEAQFAVEGVEEVDTPEPLVQSLPETQSQFATEGLEAPLDDSAAARPQPKREAGSNRWINRAVLVAPVGFLAALTVFGSVRLVGSLWGARSEALTAKSLADPTVVSGPSRTTDGGGSPAPFQVEVLDASGKRWLLGFARNASRNIGGNAGATKPAAPGSSPTLADNGAIPKRLLLAEKQRDLSLVTPKANLPSAAAASNLPSMDAPMLPGQFAYPSAEPVGSAPVKPTPPASVNPPRVGGEVRQARLIKSVPPNYPALAKSLHVGGDVVMDAIVDPGGNVTDVTVISGALLLQGAAVEALRAWKYEPARLDGQAVPMHLRVTLKFRIN